MVLSACSSYFEQLFINFSEPNQIVILKDTSFLDISAIIDFMYRGEINVSQVREGLGWKASSRLIEPSLHKLWYLMRGETAEISTSPGPAQAINCCWYNKHLYFYCAGPPLLPPQDCREPQGEGSGRGVWGRQGEDGDHDGLLLLGRSAGPELLEVANRDRREECNAAAVRVCTRVAEVQNA